MNLLAYNIRVYGVLINKKNEVLLSKESHLQKRVTKFPGGGHELGEGLIDCLKREFKEELGIRIEIIKHLYTTDYFQVSAFNDKEQLISIYYLVKSQSENDIADGMIAIDLEKEQEHSFYWQRISELKKANLTYPVDQLVADTLINNYA